MTKCRKEELARFLGWTFKANSVWFLLYEEDAMGNNWGWDQESTHPISESIVICRRSVKAKQSNKNAFARRERKIIIVCIKYSLGGKELKIYADSTTYFREKIKGQETEIQSNLG